MRSVTATRATRVLPVFGGSGVAPKNESLRLDFDCFALLLPVLPLFTIKLSLLYIIGFCGVCACVRGRVRTRVWAYRSRGSRVARVAVTKIDTCLAFFNKRPLPVPFQHG